MHRLQCPLSNVQPSQYAAPFMCSARVLFLPSCDVCCSVIDVSVQTASGVHCVVMRFTDAGCHGFVELTGAVTPDNFLMAPVTLFIEQ